VSAIVNYSSATGQYALIIVGSGNPSWIWSKWYQGPTEPDVSEPNPIAGVAPGATTWQTQISNSGSQVYGPQFVTPSAGHGVKLVVWELQADGSTFEVSTAWQPSHSAASCSQSGLAAQGESVAAPQNGSIGHAAPASPSSSSTHAGGASSSSNDNAGGRATNPARKRRDDDVVPCEVAAEH
jgi:hypothetical protein